MRIVTGVLAALGAALLVFGYWALETVAGRQAFDEMAGMIPFGAQVLGALLVILAAVIAVTRWWRGRLGPER